VTLYVIDLPFRAVKVIRVVPGLSALNVRFLFAFCLMERLPLALFLTKVATRGLELLQPTVTLVFVAPLTTTGILKVVPCLILMVLTDESSLCGDACTTIVVLALLSPASVVAVIVAVPGPTARTCP